MTAFHLDALIPKPFRSEEDQAVLIFLWGVWSSPTFRWFLDFFIDAAAPGTSRILAPMPLWAWSVIASACGVYRFAASRWLGLAHREYAATACSIFWMTIALLFFVRLPYTTGTIVYLGLAYQSVASMGRIRMLR
jgi:hypothetical protein